MWQLFFLSERGQTAIEAASGTDCQLATLCREGHEEMEDGTATWSRWGLLTKATNHGGLDKSCLPATITQSENDNCTSTRLHKSNARPPHFQQQAEALESTTNNDGRRTTREPLLNGPLLRSSSSSFVMWWLVASWNKPLKSKKWQPWKMESSNQ